MQKNRPLPEVGLSILDFLAVELCVEEFVHYKLPSLKYSVMEAQTSLRHIVNMFFHQNYLSFVMHDPLPSLRSRMVFGSLFCTPHYGQMMPQ
jgi:hypothetical protein